MQPPTANFYQSNPYLVIASNVTTHNWPLSENICSTCFLLKRPIIPFSLHRWSLLSISGHVSPPFLPNLSFGVPKLEAAVPFPLSLFPCPFFYHRLCHLLSHSAVVIFLRKSTTSVLGTLKLGDHGASCFLHMFVFTPHGCNFLVQFSCVINFSVLFLYYFEWCMLI